MQYKTVETPVGLLTLFATEKGLCRLIWGKAKTDGSSMQTDRCQKHLDQAEEELKAYFEGGQKAFKTLLDVEGSAFMKSVLHKVAKIPAGRVETYGDIANKLGTAPRAIGRAVGANPLPIFIPCHRVVGANGAMTGFSGGSGVPTKEWLLKHESANI